MQRYEPPPQQQQQPEGGSGEATAIAMPTMQEWGAHPWLLEG